MGEFAKKVRLDQIVAAKSSAVFVTTETTVENTAKLLAKKNFRSAPVYDDHEGRFVGFIDEMDILEYAVIYAHHALEKKELKADHLRDKYSHFNKEELESFSLHVGEVKSILKLPGAERRRIFVFQSNARLSNAMKILKDNERVLVEHVIKPYDNGVFIGRLMNKIHRITQHKICSQTDVLRYIVQHSRELKEDVLNSLKVKDVNTDQSLVTITVEDRAIDGFLKMLESKADACAILDNQGKIVATLSASDLRGMTDDNLKNILLPVMEFLPSMTGSKSSPLTCFENDQLVVVMKKILKASTRRCWLVDNQFRPIRLISMGKIILCILDNACEHL